MSQLENITTQLELSKQVVVEGEDLKWRHGFRGTPQGGRFTVSESAWREILSKLLKLNHERYEEEQKAEGGKPKKIKKSKSTDGQIGMF